MDIKFTNAIIVVDDDYDDLELISEIHEELQIPNPLVLLRSPLELIQHLHGEIKLPFLLLRDFNSTVMNGLKLRRMLIADENNRYLSTPFLLWSTGAQQIEIKEAYITEYSAFLLNLLRLRS